MPTAKQNPVNHYHCTLPFNIQIKKKFSQWYSILNSEKLFTEIMIKQITSIYNAFTHIQHTAIRNERFWKILTIPSPCSSVNLNACTRRIVSSTDRPTGRSFTVICRNIPLWSTINSPLWKQMEYVSFAIVYCSLQYYNKVIRWNTICQTLNIKSSPQVYHCKFALTAWFQFKPIMRR